MNDSSKITLGMGLFVEIMAKEKERTYSSIFRLKQNIFISLFLRILKRQKSFMHEKNRIGLFCIRLIFELTGVSSNFQKFFKAWYSTPTCTLLRNEEHIKIARCSLLWCSKEKTYLILLVKTRKALNKLKSKRIIFQGHLDNY